MSDDRIDDAETIVERLGLVNGQNVDWSGLARFLAASWISFIAWGIVTLFDRTVGQIAEVWTEIMATVGRIFGSLVDVLTAFPARGAEATIAYFDLVGPAAFPLAVVIVTITLVLVQRGVDAWLG